MSAHANPNTKSTPQNGRAVGAASAPIQVPSPVLSPKAEDEAPTFETIRDYLRGREVVLVSPPLSDFTKAYCTTKKDTDVGTFSCKILDVIIDSQGIPISALVEYREKNARAYGSRDLISLEGLSISTSYALPSVKEAVEDAIAAETTTKH